MAETYAVQFYAGNSGNIGNLTLFILYRSALTHRLTRLLLSNFFYFYTYHVKNRLCFRGLFSLYSNSVKLEYKYLPLNINVNLFLKEHYAVMHLNHALITLDKCQKSWKIF